MPCPHTHVSWSGVPYLHYRPQEFLPALIPILLRNMSYAEDDEEALAEAEESNAHVEDREQDLKPFHASGRSEHGAAKAEFEDDDDDDEVRTELIAKRMC